MADDEKPDELVEQENGDDKKKHVHEVWELKKKLLGLLAQYSPNVQRVAVDDLVALRVASFPEPMVPRVIEQHIESVLRLIGINRELLNNAKKRKAN